MDVTDVLEGLDALDWSAFQAAYGSAGDVPGLLRRLLHQDAGSRAPALEELWGTVWHQGTVYECSPLVVPFLAAVVTSPDGDDVTRAQVALLLASIAAATSFALPHQPQQLVRPRRLRTPADGTPARDLAEESRAAVTACAPAMATALPEAPPATRAALVAALGATAPARGSAVLTALRPFEADPDPRLATAALAVRLCAEGALTGEDLAELSSVDDDAADYLTTLAEWPIPLRVVELVRELAEHVVSVRTAEG